MTRTFYNFRDLVKTPNGNGIVVSVPDKEKYMIEHYKEQIENKDLLEECGEKKFIYKWYNVKELELIKHA